MPNDYKVIVTGALRCRDIRLRCVVFGELSPACSPRISEWLAFGIFALIYQRIITQSLNARASARATNYRFLLHSFGIVNVRALLCLRIGKLVTQSPNAPGAATYLVAAIA